MFFYSSMQFQKRSQRSHTRMPWYSSRSSSSRSRDWWKAWLRVAAIALLIPVVVWASWFWLHILKDLPDISEIENYSFNQATTITDRNGKTLYTLFEENRQYIPFEDMSEKFVNALIATEDQRFWTNPGIDRRGTLRAWLVDIGNGWQSTQWWSTITQQLIKNLMLTPEKKIERKLKEIVLAIKLNKYIRRDIASKYQNLSGDEIDRKVKEKILELYSNYIFLWNNSYGVETASVTYFDTSASDLSILEAAVLAGIPQAPSRFDPYNNRAWLMWVLEVTDMSDVPVEVDTAFSTDLIQEVVAKINSTDISFKKDDSAVIDYFKWLLSFRYTREGKNYKITYRTWRKDTVLARMYEEWYITENEFKNSFVEWFTYAFKRGKVSIDAPHFVFWVINLLEKNYDPEMLRKWWLTIKTSLDFDIQQMAEESINENFEKLQAYDVGNSAMIYMNSHDGDVLAYVWSRDYYNDEIDGQVDIIQSQRQVWSIIKPFVYAIWFMNMALTIDSPIYDIKLTLWNNTPENADGDYKWLMALKNALAYSRNIPAIKMFYSAGGEGPVKKFLQGIWMTSLDTNREYGYPLAIGAWETPMLEMANAYAHLSAMWIPAEINPILEVRASDDTLLYKKQVKTQEQVIPWWVAYLIWNMLSTKSNFPSAWIDTFSFPWVDFATKSGTTNVVKWDEKLPRDAWFAAYTPSSVMLFWWWNTDGSALRKDAFGWWVNSPIWKSFATKLKNQSYIQDEVVPEREVKSVSISKLSGKLSSFETPLIFTKKSLWYIETLPSQVDASVTKFQVDKLCNALPNELTPVSDLQDAYYISPQTIMSDNRDQGDVVEWWRTTWVDWYSDDLGAWIYIDQLTGNCEERFAIAELGEISLKIIQPIPSQVVTRTFSLWHQTKSPFSIKTIKLFLDDIELKALNYNKQWNLIDISTVTIPEEIAPWVYTLKAVAIDEKWYTDTQSVIIEVKDWGDDTTPPYLMEDKVKVTEKSNGNFEVVMLFGDDASTLWSGRVIQWWATVHSFTNNVAIFELADLGEVSYVVDDSAWNIAEWTLILKK